MAAYLTVMLIRELEHRVHFGDAGVANDCSPNEHLVGLWVSYNWAQAGLGTDLVRHVNKQKEREKKKNKLPINKLSSWPEDEKQVVQTHKS